MHAGLEISSIQHLVPNEGCERDNVFVLENYIQSRSHFDSTKKWSVQAARAMNIGDIHG
jgi:hypothetical protein